MNPLEFASLGFDIVLVLLGLYFAIKALEMKKAKGSFGFGIALFCWSLVLLGLVHMIETGLFIIFDMNAEWNELIHRILVLFGFIGLIFGYIEFKKDIFIPK